MHELKEKKNNTVVAGAIILGISNLIVKAIGLIFKIPLSRIIGDEGMGYFNAAYTIYTWFYIISTAGIPVAISIMVSESRTKGRHGETRKIFSVTRLLLLVIGTVGTAIMVLGSKLLALAVDSRATYVCIIAIAPTLFFICISSAYRGYFQGRQNMIPTALSQLIEALGKLVLGIIFANYAIAQGFELPVVAAYAIAGLTVGSALGMIFLYVLKLLHDRRERLSIEPGLNDEKNSGGWKICRELVKIAIPITMCASVMSLTNLIDVMIVIRRLKSIGFAEDMAVKIYGNYTTLAVPMFNLPTALIYPISYSITPLISAALANGESGKVKTIINSAFKSAAIITIPAALGLAAFSEPILELFFSRASAEMAAPLLSILSMSVFLVGLLTVMNASLQAYKYERKPIFAMLAGGAVKLVVSYILNGIPTIGIYGTPIGTFLCYLTITVIDFYFVVKYVKLTPNIGRIFVKPFVAAVVGVGASLAFYRLLPESVNFKLGVIMSVMLAAVLYIVMIFLIKGVSEEELKLIPGGGKLLRLMKRLKIM